MPLAGLGVVVLGLAIYTLKDSFGGSSPAPARRLRRSVAQAPRTPCKFIDRVERIA